MERLNPFVNLENPVATKNEDMAETGPITHYRDPKSRYTFFSFLFSPFTSHSIRHLHQQQPRCTECTSEGFWDYQRNRRYQDGRLDVYVKRLWAVFGSDKGIWPIHDNKGIPDRIVVDLGCLSPLSGTVVLNPEGQEIRAFRVALLSRISRFLAFPTWSWFRRFRTIGRDVVLQKFLEFVAVLIFSRLDLVISSLPRTGQTAAAQENDTVVAAREVEAAQMPHELDPLYNWVNRDVLGSPTTLTEEYLAELKLSGVICGGGDEEGRYQVELPRPGERVCYLNLEHPRVPHWLWLNEVMFTEFRDPEVFLYLLTFFSPNTEGKAKKGYMSVRSGKYRKIFGLYEESFHDFKGRYFKVLPVGDHHLFWLTLEGDAGWFPPYWSFEVALNYTPVMNKKLNVDQRDTTDILLWLFSKRPLKPKAILGKYERAKRVIVKMAGNKTTLARLLVIMQSNPQGLRAPSPSAG
ncbi:hypothetical protein PIB30_092031 [Stylosanthes scabra]|uniref:Uncharacterized protein n=1 Tax=Stylosanthes scabra TaxID=79078 RepID=A0ABU6SV55_9FABA|nr:hypothetical protein [Stylosanthes scabra]